MEGGTARVSAMSISCHCHAQVAAVYSGVDTIGAREMWQPCGNQKVRAVNGIRRRMNRRAAVRLLLEARHA